MFLLRFRPDWNAVIVGLVTPMMSSTSLLGGLVFLENCNASHDADSVLFKSKVWLKCFFTVDGRNL